MPAPIPFNLTLRVAMMVSSGALAMSQTQPVVAAMVMTLFGATLNFGMTISGLLVGPLKRLGGEPAMVLAMALACLLGFLASLAIRRVGAVRPGSAEPGLAAGT
ncbi:MAG: hypothetical protein ACK5SX_14295 [Sandaracinobacter sp.]